MYNNPYNNFSGFNQQISNPDPNYLAMLDNEKGKIEKMRENYLSRFQNQQPTLNQTIQVSPTPNIGIKYVNSIEDVSKELVFTDTPFITSDFSNMFIKNAKGEIRIFEVKEIIPKDEKETLKEQIEKLTKENELLKGMITNESTNANDDEPVNTKSSKSIETKTTSNVSVSRTSKSKSK